MRNKIRAAVGSYASSVQRMEPSGRIWPNGEFSLGYKFVGVETDSDEEYAYTTPEKSLTGEELDARLEAMHELLDEVQRVYSCGGDARLLRLTLSNVWNSHKPISARKNGLKGLTGTGARMLRSACYLLEKRLGTSDVAMVTLTVPTLTQPQRVKLAQSWGRLTNRLVQYLSRELLKRGRAPVIAGCVEVQSGRLKRYRQGYLHLHLVLPAHSNKGGCWAVSADALRTWWKEAIERILGCELTSLPRIETAQVEKSVEAYLGKYLSKGAGEDLDAFIGDLGEESVPGQWWFMSAPMRDAVKSATMSGVNAGALLDAMVNHLLDEGTGEGFEYIRHIDCPIGGKPVTVGYVGRLSPELLSELTMMLRKT